MPQKGTRREKRDRQVGIDRLSPAGRVQLPNRLVLERPPAGVGHTDIELPEGQQRLLEKAIGCIRVAQIRADGKAADLFGEPAGRFRRGPVMHHHSGPFDSERPAHRRADSAGATGDDDALALEAGVHGVKLVISR